MTMTRGKCAVLPDAIIAVDARARLHGEELGVDMSAPCRQEAVQVFNAFPVDADASA